MSAETYPETPVREWPDDQQRRLALACVDLFANHFADPDQVALEDALGSYKLKELPPGVIHLQGNDW